VSWTQPGRDHSQREMRRRLRTEARLQDQVASVAGKEMRAWSTLCVIYICASSICVHHLYVCAMYVCVLSMCLLSLCVCHLLVYPIYICVPCICVLPACVCHLYLCAMYVCTMYMCALVSDSPPGYFCRRHYEFAHPVVLGYVI
jgi:hypothetical protein